MSSFFYGVKFKLNCSFGTMDRDKIDTNKFIKMGIVILVLIVVGTYFYQNNPTAGEGVFLRCPSNLIFGIHCPGCGTQRALHHLLHLEIAEALRYNALFVIFFPMMMYGLFLIVYNIVFGTKKTILFLTNKFVIIGLLVFVLLFGILRNVSVYPFTLLSP